MIQVDLDNKSYKVCTLKSSTEYDGSTLGYIYAHSGIQNVKSAAENMFSTTFDYYIDFQRDAFCEYFDSLGDVNYALVSDIKYKNNKSLNQDIEDIHKKEKLPKTISKNLVNELRLKLGHPATNFRAEVAKWIWTEYLKPFKNDDE